MRRLITVSKPACTFNSIATPVFTSAPAPPKTYSPLVISVPIIMDAPPPKMTDVAFETSALTYVLQMALSATVDSNIACHALGMMYDPGVIFSIDSKLSNIHLCLDWPRSGS